MVTTKDVAQKAGVSTATVSRVINGSARVSPATRARILQVIQELNYVPDGLARGIATQRSHILGMIVPDIRNGAFAEIYLGASDYASQHGYVVWLVNSNDNPVKEREVWLQLRQVRVDGVLVTPVNDAENHEIWRSAPVPLCILDRNIRTNPWDFIGIDNFHGLYDATRVLLDYHHTHIGIIAGPQSNSAGRDRLAGYQAAMQEAGYPISAATVAIGDFHESSGYALGQHLLRQDPRPTAIIVCNNLMMLGFLHALAQAPDVRLGSELAVIGFDDFPLATVLHPAISVVSSPMRTLGARGAELLISRLQQPKRPIQHVVLSPHMILRGSERQNSVKT